MDNFSYRVFLTIAEYMCILPKDTHIESESEIRLETLANAPFVMQRESCDADARRIMDKLDLEVRTICHVVDDKTTVEKGL